MFASSGPSPYPTASTIGSIQGSPATAGGRSPASTQHIHMSAAATTTLKRPLLLHSDQEHDQHYPRHETVTPPASSIETNWGLPISASSPLRKGGRHVRPQRFLDRSGVFQQSKGRFHIERRLTARVEGALKRSDWFHSLINQSTWKIVLVFFAAYYLCFILWAIPFYFIGNHCGLNNESFLDALYLSVEVGMTIGFGVPDTNFEGCIAPLIFISSQAVFVVFIDAVAVGLIFTRLSRGQTRACTLVFSDKAVIRCVRGNFYFMFQVCELRKHQLVEARVRCYAIRHEEEGGLFGAAEQSAVGGAVAGEQEPENVAFQSHAMRLEHPNDELGGMLLLALPSVVVHRIDAWSPLLPAHLARGREAHREGLHDGPQSSYNFPEPLLRASDADAGGREMYVCHVCGNTAHSAYALRKHLQFCTKDDRVSGHDISLACAACGQMFPSPVLLQTHRDHDCPVRGSKDKEPLIGAAQAGHGSDDAGSNGSHGGAATREGKRYPSFHTSEQEATFSREHELPNDFRQRLTRFLEGGRLEVVVLVEGTDSTTSTAVQARHSYAFHAGDILLDHTFGKCVDIGSEGHCVVDFSRFHTTVPCSLNASRTEFMQSH